MIAINEHFLLLALGKQGSPLEQQLATENVLLVCIRPGAQTLLSECAKQHLCILYTKAQRAYVNPLLHVLDPNQQVFADRIVTIEDDERPQRKSKQRAIELSCHWKPCGLSPAAIHTARVLEDQHSYWTDALPLIKQRRRMMAVDWDTMVFAAPFMPFLRAPKSAKNAQQLWEEIQPQDNVLPNLRNWLISGGISVSSLLAGVTLTWFDLNARVETFVAQYLPAGVSIEEIAEALGAKYVAYSDDIDIGEVTHAIICPDLCDADDESLQQWLMYMEAYEIEVIHIFWLLTAFLHRMFPREEHFGIHTETPTLYDGICRDPTAYDEKTATLEFAKRYKELLKNATDLQTEQHGEGDD